MSRQQQPFPSSQRRPSVSDYSAGTRPLQISRNPRPTTPSNVSVSTTGGSPNAPSRPERSVHRRGQPSEFSFSDVSSAPRGREPRERKDSVSTTRSDASFQYSSRNGGSAAPLPPRVRRPTRQGTTGSEESESPAVAIAMSAFTSVARKATLDQYTDDEYERERRREQEEEERRQFRIREKVPGRRVNGRSKAGDIDAVLDEIEDEWGAVTNLDFNPVELALQILGDESSNRDTTSFRRTKNMLSHALKGSVDKHYQAFAAALPHHASLISHLNATQGQVKDARTALQEAKEALGSKRSDLVQLWTRDQTLEEMLRILDQIEQLRTVPDVLESLMSEKRLLQAAVLLVKSLKTINNQDMLEVGAVADLRSYLVGQEAALRDILIDEIHSHLYLKSFWCESRWAPYTPEQQSLPTVTFEQVRLPPEAVIPSSPTTPARSSIESTRLSRFLTNLTLRPNDVPAEVGLNDSLSGTGLPSTLSARNLAASSSTSSLPAPSVPAPGASDNPESDSFAYLETLLESLAVLGKLGNGLDIITQRLPNEIYALIETTVDEVGERIEYNRRTATNSHLSTSPSGGHFAYVFTAATSAKLAPSMHSNTLAPSKGQKSTFVDASRLRLTALESSSKHSDYEILRDLFWTVYSKLYALLQGLRVVYEVSNRIGTRRDFRDSSGAKPGSLFPLSDIWLPIQAEVRTLLYDYVTSEEQGSISGRNPISSINDVLREGRFNRDKSKHVFRFADTDTKLSSKTLRPHEDELNRILRETVPGLVQGSAETSVQATLSSVGTDERLLGIEQHHRLLIKPDAFYVSVLFQPMLAFLERVAAILPAGFESTRASSAVMEEFVLDVYLPQLESRVSQLFHHAVSGPEAFQPDPAFLWLSKEPLVNASTQLMALVNSLSTMLITSPFHRENYARLILTVIIQFYQRCSDRFQAIVNTDETILLGGEARAALAAQWAQHPDLTLCLSQLFDTPDDASTKRLELWKQEYEIITCLTQGRTIERGDLIDPQRNLASLGHLYRSLIWFAAALRRLKAVPDDLMSPSSPQLAAMSALTPQVPFVPPSQQANTEELHLPLSHEMTLRFHALLKTYEQLAEFILYTMRIDVECRIIRYLVLASRYGNYHPDREVGEPDPHIIDLNLSLSECHDMVLTTLPEQEQRFIFDGIGSLVERLLISTASNIRRINADGVKKILRNLLALQQCIKTIARDPSDAKFEHAKQYWALFSLGPTAMLDNVRQAQAFTFDQYKVMLDLQCGVDPTLGDASTSQTTDRNYSMYVIDLHGMELEESK